VGLEREPFVAGVTEMIDRLAAGIPGAEGGFRLLFSVSPFEAHQASLSWVRADPVEGNGYRADDTGAEGWLCPALFCYFPAAPPRIFVRAGSKRERLRPNQPLQQTAASSVASRVEVAVGRRC